VTNKDKSDGIIHVQAARADELPADDSTDPAVGRWYWVRRESDEDEEPAEWLGCVVQIGSNYAELHAAGPTSWKVRVHLDEFWETCRFEPNPDAFIEARIEQHRIEVLRLMGRVREITVRLAVTTAPALPGHSEVQALALRSSGQSADEYKAALVRAKDEELPDLFKRIKNANQAMSEWMQAKLIPLEAQADHLKPAMDAIKQRIFSVELYAGLVEQVEQVREGDPAPAEAKLHLMQRRCYMDEECLANYKAGGMEFKSLRAFDKWLGKRENLERILPFPRCIVAFRVRRHDKSREWHNMAEYFSIQDKLQLDKLTFLYIRNGEQLFRLNTAIEFGYHLFPDMTEDPMGGKVYARVWSSGHVESYISEGRYLELVAEEEREAREAAKAPKSERWRFSHSRDSRDYKPFTQDNVYYDDILKHIRDEMAQHNRLVLVLQGLLDRSPVLHPHPPWSLWDARGFEAALELVYDDSRALTPGEKPDFEAYRQRCNKSLRDGCVTVGQEVAWGIREAKKECDRLDRDWRTNRSDYRPQRFRPHGDPGPGVLARVYKWQPKARTCTYAWNRERQDRSRRDEGGIRCTLMCSADAVLNVDAYKPGDFKMFFNDPRTRAEYLKWAPLLLEAEEYHAGNREVKPIDEAPPPLRPTYEGRMRYQQRKERKALMGKAVRLRRNIHMKNGTVHAKGSLWRVIGGTGAGFYVQSVNDDGSWPEESKYISNLERRDFDPDLSVPAKPGKSQM